MESKSGIMLRILLNRFHEGNSDPLLKLLPSEEMQQAASLQIQTQDYTPALALPRDWIRHIHYTWLAPAFKQLPENLQDLVLSSLPEPQASKLSQFFNRKPASASLSEPVKTYLQSVFFTRFKDPHILPLSFLPETSLSVLAQCTKEELVEIIDFLGIYDLADEIRRIIDKNVLKTLYLCLTPKKQQFLRVCLHQKDRLSTPKLELDYWQGDRQQLENILHRRGMYRLGKALSGQHPDFVWHLTRKLDTGRGTILSKHFSQEEVPGVTPALAQQVINVFNFLKKKSDA